MHLFPENVASFGRAFDSLAMTIAVIAGIAFIIAEALLLGFVFRYRKPRRDRADHVRGENWKQLKWIFIPVGVILLLDLFIDYRTHASWEEIKGTPPSSNLIVRILGQQYSWEFGYAGVDGQLHESPELHVPVNKNVVFHLESRDVIHSFWVPQLRLKQDAVPGRVITGWFRAEKPGTYEISCAEICGVGHTAMQAKLVVEDEPAFNRYLASLGKEGMAGKRLAETKGCLACHSLDGSRKVGPSWKGIFGKKELVLTQGKEREVLVDADYIRKSILDPQADIVKGYPPAMPNLSATLKDHEIEELTEFIQSLK